MSVIVTCTLPEGIIIGADSAVSIPSPFGGTAKVYEHGEKIYQIANLPAGLAVYGLSTLGKRSVGSYLKQLETENPDGVFERDELKTIVEALRKYFWELYESTVIPAIELSKNVSFEELEPKEKPIVGLVIAGYSKKAYLPEVWEIQLPHKYNAPILRRNPGNFGTDTFAMDRPIIRYMQGIDSDLVEGLLGYISAIRNISFNQDEKKEIINFIQNYRYPIPYSGMSIREGTDYVRFLVRLTISHYRFIAEPPVVGGQVQIGKVTYRGMKFEMMDGQAR
jgi:hypothetical protein